MTNSETQIIPTIGRIVLYCLAQWDVDAITKLRANTGGHFNSVNPGDVLPGMVVNVFGPDWINIKVMLDGTDTYWATSRSVSDEPEPGKFHWMPYQKAAPARLDAIEAAITTVSQAG